MKLSWPLAAWHALVVIIGLFCAVFGTAEVRPLQSHTGCRPLSLAEPIIQAVLTMSIVGAAEAVRHLLFPSAEDAADSALEGMVEDQT